MLIDSRDIDESALPQFDVCVIGAGAAGIALAVELLGSGLTVCLLEGGGEDFESDSQELYDGLDRGVASGFDFGRLREFGGTTNHWGGRCGFLDELDMVDKPWLPNSGWPITRTELNPFYDRARKLCGFRDPWPSEQSVTAQFPAEIRFDAPYIKPYVWWNTPRDNGNGYNFGRRYRDSLTSNKSTTIILHANVVGFVLAEDARRVVMVKARSLQGWSADIRARYFILSCGGIENSRLLLYGDGKRSLGNEGDALGRYFFQHPRGRAAIVIPTRPFSELGRIFNSDFFGVGRNPEAPTCWVGLAISEQFRSTRGLPNASFFFEYAYASLPGREAFHRIQSELRHGHWAPDMGQEIWNMATDMYVLNATLAYLLRQRPPQLPIDHAELMIDIEQMPDAESRIQLLDTRDGLGVPQPAISWYIAESSRTTARAATLAVASELARLGLGRCRMESWIDNESEPLAGVLAPTFHFMGGTRMSLTPQLGVVDANCKVFGLDNLFVAGSSVFPSGGHVNPTLTIVALAIRLTDHIKKRASR